MHHGHCIALDKKTKTMGSHDPEYKKKEGRRERLMKRNYF